MFLGEFTTLSFHNYKEFLTKQNNFHGSATTKYKWEKVEKYILERESKWVREEWNRVLTILDVEIWRNEPLFIG